MTGLPQDLRANAPQIRLPLAVAPDIFYYPDHADEGMLVMNSPAQENEEKNGGPVGAGVYKKAVEKIRAQSGAIHTLSAEEYRGAMKLGFWDGAIQPLLRGLEEALHAGRIFVARRLYREPLEWIRFHFLEDAGEIYRKYFSGRELDFNNLRWDVIEKLFHEGKFHASFGHVIHPGMALILSNIIATRMFIQHPAQQIRTVGRDLVLPDGTVIPVTQAQLSPMVGISGMSFPQLSGRSILALLYAHVRHAKEGNRFFFNTGEGGPGFHLALLNGDKERLKREVIHWAVKTGQLKPGSRGQHQVEVFVDYLWRERDRLFAEFSPEDLRKAQIVAQFGSALNGIRDGEGRVDFGKLEAIGRDPHVAMIQFKLKQAAKRGAKLDAKKLDHVTARLREVVKGKDSKSPAICPEMDSFEDIALLVIATKRVTKKPVSLKFGIGDAHNAYDLMEYLKNAGAVPDHIQIDGSGKAFTPGSGNAPQLGTMGTTSLGANEAVVAFDAVLKKLGIRDRIFLSVSGDVLLPVEGIEKMTLGADGVDAARLWMGQGLGCAKARKCADGNCPWGIASKNGSVFDLSLPADRVGKKAYEASKSWYEAYVQSLTETGVMNWRTFRKTHGLHAEDSGVYIYTDDKKHVPLRDFYSADYIYPIVKSVMTRDELRRHVHEDYPEEYARYETFNNGRHLVKYLRGVLTEDPEKKAAVETFIGNRLAALARFIAAKRRSEKQIHDFIRADVPENLRAKYTHLTFR